MANFTYYESLTQFNRTRHIIEFDTRENLKNKWKEFLRPNLVTAIHCCPEDLYEFKEAIKGIFTNRFVFTKIFGIDIVNVDIEVLRKITNKFINNIIGPG